MSTYTVRRASGEDAAGLVHVLETVIEERVYSAIEAAWPVEETRRYVDSLSAREAIHVAVDEKGRIAGYQVLDYWSQSLTAMSHVGQLATFLLPEVRGKGVGKLLWQASEAFARAAGFRKLVIQVRGSNLLARGYYRRIGFEECGLLRRQVVISGVEDDEVLMELFLQQ